MRTFLILTLILHFPLHAKNDENDIKYYTERFTIYVAHRFLDVLMWLDKKPHEKDMKMVEQPVEITPKPNKFFNPFES